MTITPSVELRFHPTDIDHAALREAVKPLGTPSAAIEAALMMARLSVITAAKAEVAQLTGEMSAAKLIGAADFAWQLYAPKFIRALGPVFAEEYYRTMKAAGAGEIPMATVYALAEQHASRVGIYYHETNRDALVSGFNTFVNRRMTERVAADRVLDGYGLTARGMGGYTSRALDKAATSTPLRLKQRALDYIGTSVRRRSKLFATQEEHNISQQAIQVAWMWMQDKGSLTPAAEKVWITARDERTCKVCAPMHNVRVLLTERFTLPNQTKIYVPGVHPNCRCTVKLLDHPWKVETSKRLRPISKADWDAKEHPRGGDPENPGRFSAKARTSQPKPMAEAVDTTEFQRFLDQAEHIAAVEAAIAAATEPEVEEKTFISNELKTFISPKTFIGEKTEVGTTTAIGQSEIKSAVAGATRAKTGVMFSPAQKVQIHDATSKTFMQQSARTQAVTPKPTPTEVLPTLHLEQPVYAMSNPWEVDPGGYIEMTNDTEWQPGTETELIQSATQDFESNIESVAEDISMGDSNRITQELDDGTKFIGIVNPDYVYDVVTWAAYQGRSGDEDWTGNDTVPVQWYHDDGGGEPGDLSHSSNESYAEVAEEWNLSPEQFDVHVLELQDGHNGPLGETVQLSAATRHGYESWVTTGRYQIVATNRQALGHGVPIQFYRLEPADVEPEGQIPRGFGTPPWPTDGPE